MTPEVLAALRRIVAELTADAGVLLRLTGSGACLVVSSTLGPALGVDDVWGTAGSLGGQDFAPELVTDTDRLPQLVPVGVLRALAVEPTATLVAPVGDEALRIVLFWWATPPPADVTSTMQSEAMRRFATLAPLLASQVRARESGTRLRAVVSALDQAVVVTVAGDIVANVSAAAARLLGLQAGHLDGTTLATAVRALRERAVDPEALGVEVARLRASPTAVAHDWVWHLHGSPSHLRVTSVPVDTTTEQGRVWVFDDISAEMELLESEQRANQALEASEERYRLLAENVSDVVVMGTADGTLTWVSPSVTATLGWAPEDLVGHEVPEFVRPDHLEVLQGAIERVQGGEPARFEAPIRTAGGGYRWMEVVIRPYVEADGRPGTVGMLYDVTDRVLAQEAARRSEERYRTVAENASDVVARYGADGVIEWVFGSTEAFLGRSAEELVGTSLLDYFVEEDWGDRNTTRARLGSGEAVELLARLRRADGSTRWVELRAKAALAPDGSVDSVIGTMRDAQAEVEYREALAASERQARSLVEAYEAARDEAVRASTAKTAFLSRMSHELRTPLNAVLGFAQLLALDPLSPEQTEAVHHIRTGGRHLLDLINEIVDISRIEAGRLSLSMETVSSAVVLAAAVELVRPLAQEHDVLVVAAGADRVADVHADRQRTTQVLLNLVSNAVKYNRPGGSVWVECRAGGPGEVVFEVSDTGPGIPPELLPRLFEPFDRLGAENSDVEGTGIGLALADALARAMGGRIEVSTEVGAGSTFTLVLRAAPSDAARASTAQRQADAHHGSRLRILYVEDNPTNATLMGRVVALRPGSRLQVAVDGSRGIAAALLEPPDLVFLDLHLPDMPGEAVLEQLRLMPGLAEVPVVVVTADASPSARERLSALGSDGFLTKPIDLDDVLGWIDATASAVR